MSRCLLAAATALALAGCSRVTRELHHAQDLTYRQDFAGAAQAYQSALIDLGRDASPRAQAERAKALRALGDLYYLRLGEYGNAARTYRSLAERYPDRPETFGARVNLAEILKGHFNDPRAAITQLAALVQSFPHHAGVDRCQFHLAQAYFQLGDYAQAERELRRLIKRYPGSHRRVEAQMLLAASLGLQGRQKPALALYRKIARAHPGPQAGRAYVEMGRLYEERGQLTKAEAALVRALAVHPDPQLVALALARVRRRAALKRPVDIHDRAAIFGHKHRPAAGGG